MNLEKNNSSLPPTEVLPPNFAQNNQIPSSYAVQSSHNHVMAGNEQALINYNHITYALYAFSFFTAGLTWIIPIVMNYMKRDEARGTWQYSHFDWQIKTFWYSIFFVVVGWVLLSFGFGGVLFGAFINHTGTVAGSTFLGLLGMAVLGISYLWHLYRLVRGWIALANRRAVP